MKIKIHTNNIFCGDEDVDFPVIVEATKSKNFENLFDVSLSELKKVGWKFTKQEEKENLTLNFDLTECVVLEK
jgi:hypothetical protein